MNRYFVKFIGTFFLVFTMGNVVVAPGAGGGIIIMEIADRSFTWIYLCANSVGGFSAPAV